MIDHPFLSFKELSDDDLAEKTSQLHRNLSRAQMWGSSQETVDQMFWMLEMIEEEKMERLKKQQFEAMTSMFPDIVESDPDFKKEKTDVEPVKVSKPTKKTHELPVPIFNKEYVDKSKK